MGGLSRVAARAEAAGAAAVWACDHLFWSGPCLECLTALTVAATATTTATLGTCVLQLGLRQPAVVAKQLASLQALSQGRFVLGVGVGSHEGEYQACQVPYAGRGPRLERSLDELERLLEAGTSTGTDDPGYRQRPVPGPIPLYVGGASRAALRRAARRGDGWIPTFVPPAAYAERLQALRAELEALGRRSDAVVPAVVAFVRTGTEVGARRDGTGWLSRLYRLPASAFERHLVAGPPERCAEALAAYVAAGARHVAVMVADDDAGEHFEALAAVMAPHRRPAQDEVSPGTTGGGSLRNDAGKVGALR